MKKYQQNEIPVCPHCGKTLEEPIQDFVAPWKPEVKEECGWCYKKFIVSISGDSFLVAPLN